MASDEIEKLKNLKIGTNKTKPEDIYEEYLIELGSAISEAFKSYIEDNDISSSGTLSQSIVSIPVSNFQVEIQADEYFAYVDQGVNGTEKGQSSPFSFKYSNPSRSHVDAIRQWLPTRGLSLPSGYKSFKDFAYVIARSVKKKGIEPKNIIDGVMTKDTLKSIEEQLFNLTGIMIGFVFERSTDEINNLK